MAIDLVAIEVEREPIMVDFLKEPPDRLESSARGLHHSALLYSSIYFRDPDGARLELLADPLGEMYGAKVL